MRDKVERHLRVWVKAHIQPAPRDYGMSSIWSCSLRLAVAIGPTTAHEPSVVRLLISERAGNKHRLGLPWLRTIWAFSTPRGKA